MGYRVRTPDGELRFEGIYEVEKAWVQGLVDPEDEILEDGKDAPVRAKDHPHLTHAARRKPALTPTPQGLRVLLAVVLGGAAVVVWNVAPWALYLRASFVAVDTILMAGLLSKLTGQAFRRSGKR